MPSPVWGGWDDTEHHLALLLLSHFPAARAGEARNS
jgi:hypothetical protein